MSKKKTQNTGKLDALLKALMTDLERQEAEGKNVPLLAALYEIDGDKSDDNQEE